MKSIFITLILLISSSSYAGGSGGGNVLAALPGQLLFHSRQVFVTSVENGVVSFRNAERYKTDLASAHKFEHLKLSLSEIKDEALLKALETSNQVQWWISVESSEDTRFIELPTGN